MPPRLGDNPVDPRLPGPQLGPGVDAEQFMATQAMSVPRGQYPELPNAGTGGFMTDMYKGLARTFLLPSDYGLLAQHLHPGSKLIQDEEGNWVLDLYGSGKPEDYRYLDAPGASPTNFLQGAGLMATGGLSGLAGKALVGKALGKVVAHKVAQKAGTAIGAGTLAGGYSAGQQLAGDVINETPKDLDWNAVMGDAVVSAAGQKAFNVVSQPLLRMGRKGLSKLSEWFGSDGVLADEAIAALKAAGYNADAFTSEQVKRINSALYIFKGLPDEQLGRALGQEAFGVRPTLGSITQNPSTQMDESLIQRGKYGPELADEYRSEVTVPWGERVREHADQLAPPGDVAATQRRALDIKADTRNAFDAAFQQVRVAAGQTTIDQDVYDVIKDTMTKNIANKFSRHDVAGVMDDFPKTVNGYMDISELFAWATRANKKGAVGMEAVNTMRDGLRNPFARMLMEGDQSVIEQWDKLIGGYKRFTNLFEADDLLGQLLSTDKQGALRVSPTEAANFLLNARDAGLASKKGLHKAVLKLKDIMGPDDPAFVELKQAVGRRLIGASYIREHAADNTPGFNGQAMRRVFEDVMKNKGDTMRLMFDESEIKAFDNFTRFAAQLSPSPGKGGAPNSTTILGKAAAGIPRAIEGLMPKGAMRNLVPFMNSFMGIADSAARRGQGRSVLQNVINPVQHALGNRSPLYGMSMEQGQLWPEVWNEGVRPAYENAQEFYDYMFTDSVGP